MKKISLIIAGLFLLFMASCNSTEGTDSENSDSTEVAVEETFNVDTISAKVDENENQELGKEYTSAYICPDHCKNSGSDKEGECLNCGMELMENPNYEGK